MKRSRRRKQAVRRLSAKEHLAGSALPLRVSHHDLTRMVAPHDHDFLEIALIDRGRGEHITSRRRVLTTAGDVWIVRPGNWHTYMNVRGLGVWNCLIGRPLLRSLAGPLHEDPGAVQLFWRGPATQARDGCCLLRLSPGARIEAERILAALEQTLQHSEPSAALEARGRLWLFLSLLAREAAAQHAPAGKGAPAGAERHAAALEAVEILERRFAEDIPVALLAQEVGLSPPHLTRVFRAMTGFSPMRYQACVRVQRACLLLAESDRHVTEIGGAVGWPDPNLFARRFRSIAGSSPSAYRRERRAIATRSRTPPSSSAPDAPTGN